MSCQPASSRYEPVGAQRLEQLTLRRRIGQTHGLCARVRDTLVWHIRPQRKAITRHSQEASAHVPHSTTCRTHAHFDSILRVRLRGEPVVASAEVRHLQSHVPRLVSAHIHIVCTTCQMCHCRQKQQGRFSQSESRMTL